MNRVIISGVISNTKNENRLLSFNLNLESLSIKILCNFNETFKNDNTVTVIGKLAKLNDDLIVIASAVISDNDEVFTDGDYPAELAINSKKQAAHKEQLAAAAEEMFDPETDPF